MKYFLSLIVTISFICTSLSAVEYGYIFLSGDDDLNPSTGLSNQSVTLMKGDAIELLSISEDYINLIAVNEEFGSIYDLTNANARINNTFKNITITGPCSIHLYNGSTNNGGFLSYKLTRASEVEYKQANIVSLPAETVGQGTHEIVVEASDDLQTWTPVHSSSIGGNKAFFRTRVVEAGE